MHASPQPLNIKKFIPAAAWFLFSFVLLFMPGKEMPEFETWFSRLQPDKWIHVFLFGFQTFLIARPLGLADFPDRKKKYTFVVTGLVVCAWGLITEFIQKYFVPGRDFEWEDWGADILGCFLAAALSIRLFRR